MKDRTKGCLSAIFFMFAFALPPVSLAAGWIGKDLKVGTLAALATFALCFIVASIFAIYIETPSWLIASLPFSVGALNGAFGLIPLPFDDVIIASAGAILSFALFLKKYADAPKWIVIPLVASALYTLVGEFIPGPVDDLFVAIIALGTSTLAASSKFMGSGPQELLPPEGRS